MANPTKAKITRVKSWAFAIFVWAFLCMWLSGMTAALTAGACQNVRYEGAKKLRFCNISLTASAWTNLSSRERAKRAILYLERGIALSQIGQAAEAADAFDKALRDAKTNSEKWEQRLHQRMAQIEDESTLAEWASVVEAAR